jgi:diamine N-acetyltransferase
MVKFIDAGVPEIPAIQDIAERTWWPTYSKILSKEEIRYMIDALYSTETISETILSGTQRYVLLTDNSGFQGFASFGRRKENQQVAKLHKIYILPENQGNGYGRLLIEEVKRRLVNESVRILDLNVNRFNKAKEFYEKMGFSVLREEDVPIGPYWMNDFVMRLQF